MTSGMIGSAVFGGALIGLGAALLWLTNGRIAGVSVLLNSSLTGGPGAAVGRSFVLGLIVAGALLLPPSFTMGSPASLPVLAVAGLLVGFGTRLGNGCTSGHGVCGIGRGSTRSIAATLTFMLTAALTVYLLRHGS